jgi:dimethylhistidine N-methyltransferase
LSPKAECAIAPSQNSTCRLPNIVHLIEPRQSPRHLAEFVRAVRSGLTSQPKTLPWAYFYDAEGSRLFDAICRLPEYYLTRTEDSILRRHAAAMVAGVPRGNDTEEPTLIELGSGSALKTQRLIAAALRHFGRLHYVPIDVSPSALEESARRLNRRFPSIRVTAYAADYRRGLESIMARSSGPRLVVFLGSSLGNYDLGAAADLLAMISATMRQDDRFLLGTDMAKERALLEAAYNDAQGITSAFNLNLLHRINRELGADFQVDAFEHRAVYDLERGRVEMHLLSKHDQIVQVPAAELTVHLSQGESIHTENSHKYTTEALSLLRSGTRFVEEAAWTDDREWFRLQRWRRASDSGG